MTTVDPRSDERGVTLPELLIATALVGIVTFAISAVLLVVFGPDQQAVERLSLAHDSQLVSLYLPDDVQSAGPISASDLASGATLSCSGSTAGTNVLRLGWSQLGTTYAVSYRIATVGDEIQLIRYSCTNAGAVQQLVVAHNLSSTSGANATTPAGRRVVLTLQIGDPAQTVTITGVRRTPTPVCVVLNHAISTSTAPQSLTGTLASPPSVTVVTDGPCSGLRLNYNRGSGNQQLAFTSGVATLPSNETWAVGHYTLSITGGTETTTDEFDVVPPPCTLANLTANPSPVALDASNNLFSTVAVSVSTTGSCAGLELAYQRSAGDTEQVLQLGASAPYSATIPVAGPWTPDSTVNLGVRATGGGTPVGSGTFQVSHFTPCSVSAVNLSRTTVGLTSGGALGATVGVAVTAAGQCSSLELVMPGGPTTTLALAGSVPTYTATIPVTGPWTTGAKSIGVREVGRPTFPQTGSLTVQACAVDSVTASPSPAPRTQNGSNPRPLAAPGVSVSATANGNCAGIRIALSGPGLSSYPGPQAMNESPVGSGNWVFTIPSGASSTWTFNRNQSVTVQVVPGGSLSPLASTTFQVGS